MKSILKGFPKNLKDFANKRQVKHTSTVLEPSIPFHTLVKLVDAEDIANDKIRTQDLTLEINNITKQLHTQTIDPSSQEQLMFTQSKDPNNENKPAYKNIALIVTEQITPSLLASKNNVMMQINEMLMLDQNPHNNLSYSTSVLHPMIERKPMIIDTEAEAIHVTTLITKTILKTDIVLHREIDLVKTKLPLLHNILDHDMIITNEIHDLIVLHTDLLIDPHIDTHLVHDIDHVLIQETTIFLNIQIHTDHLQDQEILDILDLVHTLTLGTKSI